MQIDRIGFGYVKNLGGYENCKLYFEAALEPWEDPSQSLDLLRTKVAEELDLPDGWRALRYTYNQEVAALRNAENAREKAENKLKEAQEAWERYASFLESHGVDPESLVMIPNSKSEQIARELVDQQLDIATQHLLPDLSPLSDNSLPLNDNETALFVGNEYDACFDDEDYPNNEDYADPYYVDE